MKEEAFGQDVRRMLLMLARTGIRRSELLALKWEDVNLKTGLVSVRRSLEVTKAGGLRFKEPKKKRGRQVAVPSFVVEALVEHIPEHVLVDRAQSCERSV